LWPWLWRLQGLWRQGLWLSWLWLWRRLRILLRLVGHLPPLLTPSCVQACSGYIEEAKNSWPGSTASTRPSRVCLRHGIASRGTPALPGRRAGFQVK
jgi:hypothetical protein